MSKLDGKKFMVCCANGAASSVLMEITLQKVLKQLGIVPDTIHHCMLSEGQTNAVSYDIVFCPRDFKQFFAEAEEQGVLVLGMKNIMSGKEMEKLLSEHGLLD